MLGYASRRPAAATAPRPAHYRFDRNAGYQFSLFTRPAAAVRYDISDEPVSFRAVAPRLRPLVARCNGRCPECTGPLVAGEGAVVCPVCGFRRLG